MAREIVYQATLAIKRVDPLNGEVLIEYLSRPQGFRADMTGAFGPAPGAFRVETTGTNVDLSQFTTPGWCVIKHLGRYSDGSTDRAYYVKVGMWDPETYRFYPMFKLYPGQFHILQLADDIEEEYGTGTGTLGTSTNRLRVQAINAACKVSVECFEA